METTEKKLNLYLEDSWDSALEHELTKPYLADLGAFLQHVRRHGVTVYPPPDQMFTAFKKTPYDNVKVVIMGQDHYHGPGQAHGMSFSVQRGARPPPSLQNIYKELNEDLGVTIASHGCLESWAEQGVLLLNAILTVEQGLPLSHKGRGWELLTDAVIRTLCERKEPVIFVLWGQQAIQKLVPLTQEYNVPSKYILKAPHPSPFSAHNGFFGCRHFSQINRLLEEMGKEPINWTLS